LAFKEIELMIDKLKRFLKRIGVFKYYMSLKRMLYLGKKERKEEELNEIKRKKFYSQFIKANDLCFDVGANIGNRTKTFLELKARVIAIEPQESCVNILTKKFGSEITIEKVGLGPENTTMEMFIANESTISTVSKEFIEKTKDNKFKNNSWNDKVRITITTLDDLIKKHGNPSFCKIDVEGFESEVLKGLSIPIQKVSFEYNIPEMMENVTKCINKLNELSNNYQYNYSKGESMQFELPEWKSYEEFKIIIESENFTSSDFGDIYAFIKQ
jgi:FkbM family methyltransferase